MTGKEAMDRCIEEAKILLREAENMSRFKILQGIEDLVYCMERNREEIDEGCFISSWEKGGRLSSRMRGVINGVLFDSYSDKE